MELGLWHTACPLLGPPLPADPARPAIGRAWRIPDSPAKGNEAIGQETCIWQTYPALLVTYCVILYIDRGDAGDDGGGDGDGDWW